MNMRVTNGLFRRVPWPLLPSAAAAAVSSSSPIFHVRTTHRHTAAPMYMHPVKMMAPVYEPPLNATISRPMASETVVAVSQLPTIRITPWRKQKGKIKTHKS